MSLAASDGTLHASSEKLGQDELMKQVKLFADNHLLVQAYNSANALTIIVNQYRQVVLANEAFLKLVGLQSSIDILGKRPGEVINCVHAQDHPGGCGTGESCRYCNAVNLILKSISSQSANSGEVIITCRDNNIELPMNLMENVTPIDINDDVFYVISLIDISDTNRRKVFERIFFHDIINTSGGLKNLVSLLKDDVPQDLKPEVEFVEETFSGLVDQILEQRRIIEAENNELDISFIELQSDEIMASVARLYKHHEVAFNRQIEVSNASRSFTFMSEPILLNRLLGNMVKNALEAVGETETVTIGCKEAETGSEQLEFWVHNRGFIPRSIQLQIFQRSFSTKGPGRGIGTYSMKLLGEGFLKGTVGFTSNEIDGTTFFLRLAL